MIRWVLLALVALAAVSPRLLYLEVPYERDEGAYAYVAETIGRGGLPYVDAFDMKPPLVYYLYHFSFTLFGHSVAAPRITALLFTLATCMLIGGIVYRSTRDRAAAAAAMLLFGLSSSSPAYTGFNSNTEIFTLPMIVGALYLLTGRDVSALRAAASGLLLGIGFMVKQSVAPTLLVGVLVVLIRNRDSAKDLFRRGAIFSIAASIPLAVVCAAFYLRGEFGTFLVGLYRFNADIIMVYAPSFSESLGFLKDGIPSILRMDPVPWILGILGLAALPLVKGSDAFRIVRWVLPFFLVAGGVSVSLGKYYYGHYFLFILPFLPIVAGVGIGRFFGERRPAVGHLVLGVAMLVSVGFNLRYFGMSHRDLLGECYGQQPFYQSVSVGEYLKRKFVQNGTAFIIGSEPQILVYSGMRSVSRFGYLYPITMKSTFQSAFQEELFRELVRTPPNCLVFVNCHPSHFLDPFRHRSLIGGLAAILSGYELIAVSLYGTDSVIEDPNRVRDTTLLGAQSAVWILRAPTAEGSPSGITFGKLAGGTH